MRRILKSAASLVTGLALAATAAMGTTIPAGAAARCNATFQTYSPIKKGSTGAQAKAIECLLHKAGFATTVNGRFSAADAQELERFRKSIGLNPLPIGGAIGRFRQDPDHRSVWRSDCRRGQEHSEVAPSQADRRCQCRLLEGAASRQDHSLNSCRQETGREAGIEQQLDKGREGTRLCQEAAR
jgi:hypothetical protein